MIRYLNINMVSEKTHFQLILFVTSMRNYQKMLMIVLTVVVFFDLIKAFDTVDHRILLDKLEHNYGYLRSGTSADRSYLLNRQQYTKIPPFGSKLGKFTCGVPKARC